MINLLGVITMWLIILLLSMFSVAKYDIVAYGATPNDATDDTAAIRAAVQAAGSASRRTIFGTRRVFSSSPGAFIIERQSPEDNWGVKLPSNVTFDGTGIILKLRGNPSRFQVIGGDTCADVTIYNLKIDGGFVRPYGQEQVHALAFYRANDIAMYGVEAGNVPGSCVFLGDDTKQVTISDCRFYEFGQGGIEVTGGGLDRHSFTITNNSIAIPSSSTRELDVIVETSQPIGMLSILNNKFSREVKFSNVSSGSISGNHVGKVYGMHVSNVYMVNNNVAESIRCDNCDRVEMVDNRVGSIALRLGNNESSEDVVIMSNEVNGSGDIALYVEHVTGLYAEGNIITGNFDTAMLLSNVPSAELRHNRFTANMYGLNVVSGGPFQLDSLITVGNHFSGHTCDFRVATGVPIKTCIEDNKLSRNTRCITGGSVCAKK